MFERWPAALAAALALFVAAAAAPSSAGDEIVLSQYGIAAITLPFAVALDRGYFKEQGLEIDGFISSNGGGSSVRNMIASGMPFSELGLPAAIAAVHQGIPLKIVYAAVNDMGETSWVVKQDSPVKTIADMKGRKMGYIGPQSATEVIAHLSLQRAGIAQSVQFVPTGGQGGAETALDSGAVDAIPLSDPVLTQTANKYRVLFHITDLFPQLCNQVGVVNADWAKAHPDTVRKLILARREAVDFIYAHPNDAAKVYARVWKSDDALAQATLAKLVKYKYWSDGTINAKAMDNMMEGIKLIDDPSTVADWRSITDSSYLPKRR
jgi:NitT/TauT family transport system substrate-binding protein